jgi:capsular polysaccharide biosynthesis protein
VDLSQLLALLRRRIRVIAALTALGAIAALAASLVLPRSYEARASLIAPSLASTYAEVADSRPVLEFVIAEEALDVAPDDLDRSVDAVPSQTSALVTISVRDPDAARAASIANAIADRVVELAPDIAGTSVEVLRGMQEDLATVEGEISRVQAAIAALAGRSELTPDEAASLEAYRSQLLSLLSLRVSLQETLTSYAQSVVRVLVPAVAPSQAAAPSPVLATISGGIVGLAIALFIAIVPTALRPRPTAS